MAECLSGPDAGGRLFFCAASSAMVCADTTQSVGDLSQVFEIIKSGGWIMLPIILCSIAALAIVVERFWSLQKKRILPPNLVSQVWQWAKAGVLDAKRVQAPDMSRGWTAR